MDSNPRHEGIFLLHTVANQSVAGSTNSRLAAQAVTITAQLPCAALKQLQNAPMPSLHRGTREGRRPKIQGKTEIFITLHDSSYTNPWRFKRSFGFRVDLHHWLLTCSPEAGTLQRKTYHVESGHKNFGHGLPIVNRCPNPSPREIRAATFFLRPIDFFLFPTRIIAYSVDAITFSSPRDNLPTRP